MSPFHGETMTQTFEKVKSGSYDFECAGAFENISQKAKNFIERLLVKDPKYELNIYDGKTS